MPYPPDLIVNNETVPVPLPAVTGRLIVSSLIVSNFLRFSFSFCIRTLVSRLFLATFAFLSNTNFVSYRELADTREPNRRTSWNYKFESFPVLRFEFERSRTSWTFARRSSKRVRFGKTDRTIRLSRVGCVGKGTNPRTSITLFSVVRRISHRPSSLTVSQFYDIALEKLENARTFPLFLEPSAPSPKITRIFQPRDALFQKTRSESSSRYEISFAANGYVRQFWKNVSRLR